MDLLLRTIRSRLIGDSILASMVHADDITSSYNAESANYPCIVLSIDSGGAFSEIYGVTKASLVIDIYSNTNKQHLWTIYGIIRSLLHNCELDIRDSLCVIHVIYEAYVNDDQYDVPRDVWHLSAKYGVIYSTTGLSITTGVNGLVYADRALVKAIPSMEIAKFRGQVSLDISFEGEVRTEQERFGKTFYYHTGSAKLTFEEMMFKVSILDLLWNITTNVSGKLNDGVTSATTYQVSQSSYPSYIQVLFQMIKTDDGKKLEIEAYRASCQNVSVPFSRTDFSIFNCVWLLFGDASGNVVKVSVEN